MYIGGTERNKHGDKQLRAGRGPVGKTAVVGMQARSSQRVQATPVARTDAATLQNVAREPIEPGATVYTDDHRGYIGLSNHESVNHRVSEYARD